MGEKFMGFKKDSPSTGVMVKWWERMDDDHGERAVLRRCHTLTEIVFSPAYHRLRLALERFGEVQAEQLALVTGLAARVKSNIVDGRVAEQMAIGKADGSARVSGLRFRRLLKIKDREKLFTTMTRIIALLGGSANLPSLAQSMYFWNDKTRKEWAFDYYSKAVNEK